ncbi:NAD-dependent protein deacetylase sirtuin-3 isoform X2 [Paramormyrops kingsleyae]|uniref:NAD-dependent protein deacetylase sirtuin-3 isoform X2 n=1 Tax=Paramormyrops kingsleyae TaxID=1676925 RepID=UPI000CD61B58|nr:NAD-dependent protein deacetylase sirtuin-3-like isoform X2 [Paramormyrops kingsleyae]
MRTLLSGKRYGNFMVFACKKITGWCSYSLMTRSAIHELSKLLASSERTEGSMSKAKPSKERRPVPLTLSRVTRSSSAQARQGDPTVPQDASAGPQMAPNQGAPRGRQADSALAQDLSLMSMSEQEATLPRHRTPPGMKSSRSPPRLASKPIRTAVPRGTLNSVARLLKLGRCRNVLVVAGAGISTASGIPDFRTPGTGLYANLQRYHTPFPEAIFNIDFFSNDPRPFFSLAKELYPGRHRPNYVHYFIRMLHQKGLLLRMYTQNIDGLEQMCGIPEEKLVEAHGSFASASCHLCYTPFPAEEAKKFIMTDRVPLCTFCQGTVKPDIVFFGEDLPQSYFQHIKDFPKADLLIIMGTSLQIEPFASLVNTVRSTVPRLLLNRDPVGPFQRVPLRRGDYMELGDLLDSVRKLAQILGWHQDICDLIQDEEQKAGGALSASGWGLTLAEVKHPGGGASGRSGDESSDDSEADSKSTESSAPSS